MTDRLGWLLIACILSMFSIGAHAQSDKTVVVIPMFGDDAAAKWRGEWANGTEYKKGDLVHDLGSSYIATSDHLADNTNSPQDTFNAWDLVAASGANGQDGNDGNDGAKGSPGAAATINVGNTITGDAGTLASVENSGSSSAATFDFTIPKGAKGDQGDTGLLDQAALDFMLNSIELGTIKRIAFATTAQYDGNLVAAAHSLGLTNITDGLQAGDALCSFNALYAGLPGWANYKAWLSSSTGSPVTRFTKSLGPYVRTDGAIIANNWTDLVNGSLINPINLTEGGGASSQFAITATTPGGDLTGAALTCNDWTTDNGDLFYTRGDPRTSFSPGWTQQPETARCFITNSLYCFQQ